MPISKRTNRLFIASMACVFTAVNCAYLPFVAGAYADICFLGLVLSVILLIALWVMHHDNIARQDVIIEHLAEDVKTFENMMAYGYFRVGNEKSVCRADAANPADRRLRVPGGASGDMRPSPLAFKARVIPIRGDVK